MPGNFDIREIWRNPLKRSQKKPSGWPKKFILKFLIACQWMFVQLRPSLGYGTSYNHPVKRKYFILIKIMILMR
jgi:hypothetical protein